VGVKSGGVERVRNGRVWLARGPPRGKSYEDWSVITPNLPLAVGAVLGLPSILLVVLTCSGRGSGRKFCAEESDRAMGQCCGRQWICSHTFSFGLFGQACE
jgi:hypothetical protein